MAENLEKKAPNVRFKGFTYDWELQKFNNVFNSISNNSLSRNDLSYEKGSVINIHYGDLLTKFDEYLDIQNTNLPKIIDDDKATKASRAKLMDGDIIIADTAEDETAGKCVEIGNLTDSVVVSGLHTMAQRPKFEFGKRYLGVYMNSVSYHKQLLPLMQGIKVISISKTAIASTIIVYPQKIEEQNKIGAIFKIISNLLTLYQRKIGLLQQLKKAMLQRLFPDTDTYPKLRFGGFSGPWEQRKLGDEFERVNERNNGQFKKNRWISVANMYFQNPDKVQTNNIDTRTYVMRYGDIAFEGHPNKEFKFGRFVANDIGDGVVSELFPIYRHIALYDNNYWKYAIHLESIMSPIFAKSLTSSGNSSNKLETKHFLKQKIYVPTIVEQKQIGNFFVKLDTLIALQQRNLDNMHKLKKFMLQNLFI